MTIDRRHHLRHDNPSCIFLAQEHQLTGQGSAADERNAGVNHAWVEITCLLDESRRGPIGGHHNHCFYLGFLNDTPVASSGTVGRLALLAFLQLPHGLVYINGISLIIEPQNRALVAALQRTNSLFYAGEARISVSVLLGKDGNLRWR